MQPRRIFRQFANIALLLTATGLFAPLAMIAIGSFYSGAPMNVRRLPLPDLPQGIIFLAATLLQNGRRVAASIYVPSAPENYTSGTLSVRVWDSNSLSVMSQRVVDAIHSTRIAKQEFVAGPREYHMTYSPSAETLVVSDETGNLHILRASDLHEIYCLHLGLPAERPLYGPVALAFSPDSRHLAVLVSNSLAFPWLDTQAFLGGEVRMYDIDTGHLVWKLPFSQGGLEGVAWSPGGKALAVTVLSGQGYSRLTIKYARPAKDVDNLFILDSANGEIRLRVKTHDLAGPVCFGPKNQVFTAPLHLAPESYGPFSHQKVKVWNATTGRLEREIACPGRDVHNFLGLADGGRMLVGYVGKEKLGFSWRAMEDVQEVLDRKFAIWNAASGKLLAISPEITGILGNVVPGLSLAGNGTRALAFSPYPWNPVGPPVLFDDLPGIPPEAHR